MTYIDERIAGYFEALDHAGIERRDQLVIRSVDAWAEDVAVVGFDDERAAQLLNPQLTTIRQPYSEMGTQAVTLLRQAINGDPAPSTRIELPTTLVVRGSSTTR